MAAASKITEFFAPKRAPKRAAEDTSELPAKRAPPAASASATSEKLPHGIDVHPSWASVVAAEARKPYFSKLMDFVAAERGRTTVYPEEGDVFTALKLTPLDGVKVVIVGQDPYHGPGQAHGLAFSVRKGVSIPPSLRNIYKELQTDCGCSIPSHGQLSKWASQGVLLLNTVLTVERAKAHSHKGMGWESFTAAILRAVASRHDVAFLLWGKPAETAAKSAVPLRKGHCVLKSVHPSPLSAHRGFMGCRHFSKANHWLAEHGQEQIDWQID
jgi:uracil-DNA glycosylase